MFERFTDRARRVVVLAQEEARLLNHCYIGTEHILLGLIHEGEGVAAKALESLGISLEAVRSQVEEMIGQGGSSPSGPHPVHPPCQEGPRAVAARSAAARPQLHRHRAHPARPHPRGRGRRRPGARQARRRPVAASASRSSSCCPATRAPAGGPRAQPEGAGANVGGSTKDEPAGDKGGNSQILDQFGRNLTQLAREHKLDPMIGRTRELERVMQILSPAHEEQPGAHRRAGRRQDRDRRGPRPDDRQQRRPRHAAQQAAVHARPRRPRRRQPLPRRLRGAPQEGAQGDQDPRRHPAVHRRDPHARRRRRRRGRDRRGVDPQADARPRRAADDRRHHARRVPQVRREGRRARAPLPAGARSKSRRSPTRSRS